jgi:hypothetical protein
MITLRVEVAPLNAAPGPVSFKAAHNPLAGLSPKGEGIKSYRSSASSKIAKVAGLTTAPEGFQDFAGPTTGAPKRKILQAKD